MNNFFTCDSPHDAWEMFIAAIHYQLDITCPIKDFNFKQAKKPWITREMIYLMKDKDEAWSYYCHTKDPDDYEIARFLRNRSKIINREAERKFHRDKIEANKNKPKDYWRSINRVVNPKPSSPTFSLIDKETETPVAYEDTARFINEYFATIGEKLAQNLNTPWVYRGNSINTDFMFHDCTLEELEPLLRKIDVSKSSGVDNISTQVLKDALTSLPHHALHIFKLVTQSCSFPDSWKLAKVSPLPKGGDITDVNNLRPISILPLPAKIMDNK